MAYTADDLLAEVRRSGSLPSAAATGTADADILAHADSELRDTLVPMLLNVREEYYQRVFDTTVTAGTATYRLNKRLAHSRVNTVQWLDASSNIFNLARLEPRRVPELQTGTTSGNPWAYYLEGSRVVLFPTPSASGTLRIRGFVRPGRLALVAASGSIAITVVTGTTSYVLTITGHTYTTSTPVDVIAATPSFEHLAIDTTPTATASNTITMLATGFTTAPAVGDYVVAPDTSPFIQLPVELHPALIELTTARVLRALGKLTEAQAHSEEAKRMAAMGVEALTPRTENSARKITGGRAWRRQSIGTWGRW